MLSAFAAGFLLLLLCAAGFGISAGLLRETRAAPVLALSALLPLSFLLVIGNACAYVMPISEAFFVSLFFLLCIGGVGVWRALPLKQYAMDRCTLILTGIGIASGLLIMRTLGSDPWFWAQYPLSASIAAGNFPVAEVPNPWNPAAYHYGPQFLAAAFHTLTGLSYEAAFGLQACLGAVGILLAVAALLKRLGYADRTVLWASILAFAGGGLAWLQIGPFLMDLYRAFVLHLDIHPFSGLVFVYGTNITNALFTVFLQRSTALGYAFFYVMIYGFHTAFYSTDRQRILLWILCLILLSAALALTMETGLIILCASCGLYALLLPVLHLAPSWKKVWLICAIVMGISLLISVVQGGVLSGIGTDHSTGSFSFFPDWRIHTSATASIPFWNASFLQAFGVPLFLLPFILLYCWRRRHEQSVLLLLCLIALVHLLLPFVAHFVTRPSEMVRLFFGATSMLSLLGGIWIFEYLKQKRWGWMIGPVLLGAMLFCSLFYALVRLTVPTLRPERPVLMEYLPSPTPAESAMYTWIDTHTTLQDYFYVRSVPLTPSYLEASAKDVITFMTRTGRFTIDHLPVDTLSADRQTLLAHIESSCDPEAFRQLQIRYLVVLDPVRADWFRTRCSPDAWTLSFDGSTQNDALYPRVYAFQSSR